MGLRVLDDFPARVLRVEEKWGCMHCPFMQEFPYGETFEPECTVDTLIKVPSCGVPPECPLRKDDIVVSLDVGR